MTSPSPFAALGLPARPDLSDDEVRNAWRRIASATHPDREDGGDPARYAEASGAYTVLRTAWGRSEAYADLATPPERAIPPPAAISAARPSVSLARRAVSLPVRIRHGRPGRLTLRILAAIAAASLAWHSGGGTPPVAALLTGIFIWLALTGRADLAPPPGR